MGPVEKLFASFDGDKEADILTEVAIERGRQHLQWGVQNHPNGTGAGVVDRIRAAAAKRRCQQAAKDGTITYRLILDEEVKEAFAEKDPKKLRAELIQTGAVIVQWVKAIDRGEQP